MSIKFTCPHCKKTLKVADDRGGKKGKCPSCQKPVVIPKQGTNGPATKSISPASNPKGGNGSAALAKKAVPSKAAIDIDALAMEALSEPKVEEVVTTTFRFKCDFCDDEVEVNTELCGKQAPCPACRRIIKIPLQKKAEAKDWRKVEQLPTAARRDLGDAPEGAWGSATASRVSVDSLEEAGAIKHKRIPWTPRQKVARGMLLAAGLLVTIVVASWSWSTFAHSRLQQSIRDAEAYLPGSESSKTKITGPAAAEVYRVLGMIDVNDFKAAEADRRFSEARRQLEYLRDGGDTEWTDRDRDGLFVVLALAQAQLELGEDRPYEGRRLAWDTTHKKLQQTLGLLATASEPGPRADAFADARAAVITEFGGILLDRKLVFAETITSAMGNPAVAPELNARFGLLYLMRGEKARAEAKAEQALKEFNDLAKEKRSSAPPVLVALLLGLRKEEEAEKLIPVPTIGDRFITEPERLAYAHGWALQDRWADAKALATTRGEASARLLALHAIAEVAARRADGELGPIVELALAANAETKSPGSSWILRDLVRYGLRAKIPADQLKAVHDPWARLEFVRAKLDEGNAAETAWAEEIEDKESLPYGLALEWIATRRAKQGGHLRAQIPEWKPEWVQALGYAGTALGLHVPPSE